MVTKTRPSIPTRLLDKIEQVPLRKLKPYAKNPRRGNVDAIAESLFVNGQFIPILVQKSSGEIIKGNHTWQGACLLDDVANGKTEKPEWLEKAETKLKRKLAPMPTIDVIYIDVDNKKAAQIVVSDNRTSDLGSYDAQLLKEILEGIGDATGTGYSDRELELIVGIADQSVEEVRKIFADIEDQTPQFDISGLLNDMAEGDGEASQEFGFPDKENDDFDDGVAELQGVLELKSDMKFPSSNYWEIPELRPEKLLQKLPTPFDTWGGKDATPDDGKTTYLYNYGAVGMSGLPCDRAILCFFTYDLKFENWWQEPGFQTAKAMNYGLKMAVVPDFSFYDDMTRAEMLFSVFKAQWVGRYLQEAGFAVAPRIQFSLTDRETFKFNLLGIPKGAPVVFTSQQNDILKEKDEIETAAALDDCVAQIECKTLVVYGGNPAKRTMERMKSKCKLVHVMNVAGKRRGVVYDKKEGLAGKKKIAAGKKRASRERAEDDD